MNKGNDVSSANQSEVYKVNITLPYEMVTQSTSADLL